jgi:HEPN domain-containing protein
MSEKPDPVALWLHKAEEDLRMAELALGQDHPLTSSACFHCQQCAEKYLKALLIRRNIKFPPTHDLGSLVSKLIELFPESEDLRERAEELTEYAVEVRYPDDFYTPTVREAREALSVAISIKEFCLSKL